ALLLFASCCAKAPDTAEDLTPKRRQELEKLAAALHEEGVRALQTGNYAKASEVFREALDMKRALFPKAQYPDGHTALVQSLNNLAVAHSSAGEYGKAEPLLREALRMDDRRVAKDR